MKLYLEGRSWTFSGHHAITQSRDHVIISWRNCVTVEVHLGAIAYSDSHVVLHDTPPFVILRKPQKQGVQFGPPKIVEQRAGIVLLQSGENRQSIVLCLRNIRDGDPDEYHEYEISSMLQWALDDWLKQMQHLEGTFEYRGESHV